MGCQKKRRNTSSTKAPEKKSKFLIIVLIHLILRHLSFTSSGREEFLERVRSIDLHRTDDSRSTGFRGQVGFFSVFLLDSGDLGVDFGRLLLVLLRVLPDILVERN